MRPIRNLAYLTAALAYTLIVLGAVVRVSGSGLGCGDHWPMCNGHWFPPFDDMRTVIEWSHRLVAATLGVPVFILAALAYVRRKEPGGSGPEGILRPAVLAGVLLVIQALLGAVTVWIDLHLSAVLLHLVTAMAFIATLLVVGFRAGAAATPARGPTTGDPRAGRAAIAALVLGGVTVLLGGVTATTGAAGACQGFPLCNGQLWPGSGAGGLAHIQWTHRLLAYLLSLHLIGLAFGAGRRNAPPAVQRLVWIALAVIGLQLTVAALMVLNFLPPTLRALHAAIGSLLWVVLVALAWHTSKGTR